ncbi:DUF4249 domain-containing protein [Pontibacter sp. H259]|uniref:DUF4249 domain-containing protein n=1 Tax=Pontibacter sp. H259 TaxID=3133421 RepID=UPI0030BD98E2
MKMQNWKNTLGWLLMLLVSSCVEPFTPEVLEAPNTFLVVNGFINANGPTTIKLLRTQNLYETTVPPAESNAQVKIEADNGESYWLQEDGNAEYKGEFSLNQDRKYRLYIKTQDGKEYASDFVEVKKTPAIDEVTWKPVGDQAQVYVSTHDPENKTRYYRWEYEETWHYRSALYSILIYDKGKIRLRDEKDKHIYNCWKSIAGPTIEIGNSVRLTQDVISDYKLNAIPANSEKIGLKYSILVKQYALTQEAYTYLEILKKNTENIGTLYDPLPSQLTGNIRCLTNPEEPVIGFVSATTMQVKRLFIENRELPREWRTFSPYCEEDTMLLAQANIHEYFQGGHNIPVSEVYAEGSTAVIGYTYGSSPCVDCTTRGTNVKPAFWE